MDILRYWVTEMHVDGFRFDLASTLARELHDVDRLSAFFDLIQQDPVVSQVKLIAEPWDVGEGGYQVGNFPPLWSEWNGKYRDTVRDFWRGEPADARRVRVPLHRQLRPVRGRRPAARRQHQLRHRPRRLHAARPRLVQREAQRGQRRGQPRRREPQPLVELRRRGPDRRPARSSRCAPASSATSSPRCSCRRACRCCSAGDEIGRTPARQQQRLLPGQRDLAGSTGTDGRRATCSRSPGALIALRRDHPVFRRRRWFQGRPIRGTTRDIGWFKPDGTEMTDERLGRRATPRASACSSTARPSRRRRPRGERIVDDSFLVLFNGSPEPRRGRCRVRGAIGGTACSTPPTGRPNEGDDVVAGEVELVDRSILVLRLLDDD